MTVRLLIEMLQTCPPDAEVFTYDNRAAGDSPWVPACMNSDDATRVHIAHEHVIGPMTPPAK